MAVASQAALIETPLPVESAVHIEAPAAEALQNLVHELCQPLSSIEAIAYYLEMTLPAEQFQARQYMWRLQQLVEQANAVLERHVGITRKPCGRAQSLGAQ